MWPGLPRCQSQDVYAGFEGRIARGWYVTADENKEPVPSGAGSVLEILCVTDALFSLLRIAFAATELTVRRKLRSCLAQNCPETMSTPALVLICTRDPATMLGTVWPRSVLRLKRAVPRLLTVALPTFVPFT